MLACLVAYTVALSAGGPPASPESVDALVDRVKHLVELDDGLSTITARLDLIEMRQETPMWRWTTGFENVNYNPALRDRRRAFRQARETILQTMLLEWDPWIWEDEDDAEDAKTEWYKNNFFTPDPAASDRPGESGEPPER